MTRPHPRLLVLALCTLLLPGGLVALGTLATFSNGAVADAAAVNANFSALGTAVQTLETNAVRVFRRQASFGTLACGGTTVTVPGSLTFQGRAGDWVTVEGMLNGRANANGHLYGALLVDGSVVTRFAAPSNEAGGTWIRTLNSFANVQLTTTGSHTLTMTVECGNGMSSFADTNGEWPLGGGSYRVTVGG